MTLKFFATFPQSDARKIIVLVNKAAGLDIRTSTRERNFTRARKFAMFAIREVTGLSYPFIGRMFGKHHTTVLHHCREIAKDATARQDLAVIRAELEAAQ